ncbi:MAG: endo alpha-1,4 polygalactosaminidase [Acidobacteria bacterium]|nr:endo alpha-1,4 polygalactosaminidase [Acidobacteriota bacterium]
MVLWQSALSVSLFLGTPIPWAVCYSDAVPADELERYSLLVLHGRYHPPLPALSSAGKRLFGYVSLGEVEKTQPHFTAVRKQGLLRGENANWPGSYFVDLRDPRWHECVLRQLIPEIRAQGFHGVFLDTIDTAEHLETLDPGAHRGMMAAALDLVRAIRHGYPDMPLILNRGFFLLEEAAPLVDYVLAESIYSDYDSARKAYRRVPAAEYSETVRKLAAARTRNPGLTVLS